MQDMADVHWTSLLRNGRSLNTQSSISAQRIPSSAQRNRSRSRSSDASSRRGHHHHNASFPHTARIVLPQQHPIPYHETGFAHEPLRPSYVIPPPAYASGPTAAPLPAPHPVPQSYQVGLGPISGRAASFSAGPPSRPPTTSMIPPTGTGGSANAATQHAHVSPPRPDFLNALWDQGPARTASAASIAAPHSGPERCGDCGAIPQTECSECNEVYCSNCFQVAHSKGRRREHRNYRSIVPAPPPPPPAALHSDNGLDSLREHQRGVEDQLRFYETEHQTYASNFSRVQKSLESAVLELQQKESEVMTARRESNEVQNQNSMLRRQIEDLQQMLMHHVADRKDVRDSYNSLISKAQTDLHSIRTEVQRREAATQPPPMYRS
jgi:Skp family chaperone for outer membrane proteins